MQSDMAKRLRTKTRLLEETRKYIDKLSLELQETNEKLASFEAQVHSLLLALSTALLNTLCISEPKSRPNILTLFPKVQTTFHHSSYAL